MWVKAKQPLQCNLLNNFSSLSQFNSLPLCCTLKQCLPAVIIPRVQTHPKTNLLFVLKAVIAGRFMFGGNVSFNPNVKNNVGYYQTMRTRVSVSRSKFDTMHFPLLSEKVDQTSLGFLSFTSLYTYVSMRKPKNAAAEVSFLTLLCKESPATVEMYISATMCCKRNETLNTLKLYVSLSSIFHLILWQCSAKGPVRFKHKSLLVRVRIRSYFV